MCMEYLDKVTYEVALFIESYPHFAFGSLFRDLKQQHAGT